MNTFFSFVKHLSVLRLCGVGIVLYLTLQIHMGHTFFLLSSIDLIFHEAGHMIFMPFGRTLHILGGTLMQLIVPLLLIVHFLRQRDFYASALFVWWLGENLINISIYIADANALVLPLLGGGDHDWNNLLADWKLLVHAELIGDIVWYSGILILYLSILWMLYSSKKSTTHSEF